MHFAHAQVSGGFCDDEDEARAACTKLQDILAPRKAAAQPAMRALGAGPVLLAAADDKQLLFQEQSFRHMIQVRGGMRCVSPVFRYNYLFALCIYGHVCSRMRMLSAHACSECVGRCV